MPAEQVLSSQGREVLVVANPTAGAGGRKLLVDELCRLLQRKGFESRLVTDPAELSRLAEQGMTDRTLRAVIAAGGDGTVGMVVNHTPPGTPLAVLPLGTENLLARQLSLSADAAGLCRLVEEGCCVTLDAGQAGGRVFSLMAGCGFDADVVQRLHSQRKGNIRHLSYAKPILDAIRNYQYPELRVSYAFPGEAGGELTEQITARWVFVVNLPRYAGGLSFAPDASATDGLLDVCTFRNGSLWTGLTYLGGVVLGQHEGMADFVRIKTSRLRIEPVGDQADMLVPYQLDGDPGGQLPIEISVLPRRLRLIVARDVARRFGDVQLENDVRAAS